MIINNTDYLYSTFQNAHHKVLHNQHKNKIHTNACKAALKYHWPLGYNFFKALPNLPKHHDIICSTQPAHESATLDLHTVMHQQ